MAFNKHRSFVVNDELRRFLLYCCIVGSARIAVLRITSDRVMNNMIGKAFIFNFRLVTGIFILAQLTIVFAVELSI